jgi:hypothetical protein
MTDCGCNSGGHAGWNQGWRAPLRQSLDWLRDEIVPLFEATASQYFREPWNARDDYISVVLNRSPEIRNEFFAKHASRELNDSEKVIALKLLELQRHAMLMYTSCGWFFDEISGIESVQVIQYAARTLQLAREVLDKDLEPGFLERLDAARSNIPANEGGRRIYEKFVKPAMVDWPKAAAHYAISSLFRQYEPRTRIFSFTVEDEARNLLTSGKTRLAIGRTKLISEITSESDVLSYAFLYMGEHNLTGGVRQFESQEAYETMANEIKAAYETSDFPETIRVIDRHFGQFAYSLTSLFKDEQRRILDEILSSTREDLESRFRLITERYEPLVKFLQGLHAPPPPGLETVFDFVLHSDIRREIQAGQTDLERLRLLLEAGSARNGRVLNHDISFVVKNKMERLLQELAERPQEIERIQNFERFVETVMPVPLGLNLWRVQDLYWEMLQKVVPQFQQQAQAGDEPAREWLNRFASLGDRLGFAIKDLLASDSAVKMAA